MDKKGEKNSKNWAFKTFYYNKNDKRVWTNKYNGRGTTLNMAQKQSYLFLAAILMPPLLIVLVILIVALLSE